jgi:dimethylhistidine N-methyltransferase
MSAITFNASKRLDIIAGPKPRSAATFGDDVRAGFSAQPKRLASKYFYDELGSALFEAITLLPEYYLTRAETDILRQCGWEIVRALGNPVEFVELGSGSAVKTRILIEEALRVQRTLRYSPVDISTEALRASAQLLVERYEALTITGYAADYFSILKNGALKRTGRVLAMFMGSNIGNYEPQERRELLLALAASLKAGDGVLVGIDLKKDSRTLELAYDDPTGVTAAFNKNLLARINRELGGHFDLDDFLHVVTYDAQTGCVRSDLEAQRTHTVRIDALDLDVPFAKGERVHTESSYKFSPADIASLAQECGLRLEHSWTDPQERFSVNLLVK